MYIYFCLACRLYNFKFFFVTMKWKFAWKKSKLFSYSQDFQSLSFGKSCICHYGAHGKVQELPHQEHNQAAPQHSLPAPCRACEVFELICVRFSRSILGLEMGVPRHGKYA